MMMIFIANILLIVRFKYAVARSGLNHVGIVTPIELQQFFAKGQHINKCLKIIIHRCMTSTTYFSSATGHECSICFAIIIRKIPFA
jgi:hypothetical protein